MSKKKASTAEMIPKKDLHLIEQENSSLTESLSAELETNPEFSLDVDPTDKYSMSEEQKTFIKNYVEFKSIPMAAELSGIDIDVAKTYFVAYSSQQEIRRINRAMYQRQFSHKLLTIDELGGYLSSLITDENVPLADRVKTMDKVRIAQMLIDLQTYKNEGIDDPSKIIDADIEGEIKNLSVKSIKLLIAQNNKKKDEKEKNEAIKNASSMLSPEEEVFLKTLPTKDILNLIEETSKGGNKDDE